MSINGYVFDDSPRKDLQAQMRQSQKMEALGRLAGGVAHDFNNVLMVINGLSETVLAILEPDSPVREDLEEILAAGRRAAGAHRAAARLQPQARAAADTFDLDEAIGAMKPMLRRLLGADIALVVEPSPEPKWIIADRGQIEQVLLNLAANARDAMPEGGELRIDRRHRAARLRSRRATCCRRRRCVLRLADTGQGMSPDVQARLFEPYFTTKARGKGTGLGLSTVYAIVSESGGRITVESHRGVGTTFTIALPLALPPEFAIGGDPHPFFAGGLDGERDGADRAGRRRRSAGPASRHEHAAAGSAIACCRPKTPTSALARLREHGAPIDCCSPT